MSTSMSTSHAGEPRPLVGARAPDAFTRRLVANASAADEATPLGTPSPGDAVIVEAPQYPVETPLGDKPPVLSVKALPAFTLLDLINAVLADPNLSKRRKGEMASAVRRVAAVLDPVTKDLSNVVAGGGEIRRRIAAITPDKFDVKKGRRDNIVSLVRQALEKHASGRTNTKWSPRNLTMSRAGARWFQILKIEKDDKKKDPLAILKGKASRFAKYCETQDIAPDEVTPDLYLPFMAWNEATSWNKYHHSAGRASVHAYNKLITTLNLTSCASIAMPEEKAKPNSISIDRFAASFGQDVAAYKAHCATFGGRGRSGTGYAPQTIEIHKRTIVWAAGLLVRAGEPITNITCIRDLLAGDRPRRILMRLEQEEIERLQKKEAEGTLESGNQKPLTQMDMVKTLRTIAKNWCRPTQRLVDKLSALVAESRKSIWVDPETGAEVVRHVKGPVGLTQKNQRRLDQVTPRILIQLVGLPELMMARVDRACAARKPTKLEAKRYAAALAMCLELKKPDRVRDLANLSLRSNFAAGIKTDRYDFVSSKTGRNRTIILKGKQRAAHARFCERYRKALLKGEPDADWLFPGGDKGGRMDASSIARMVGRMVERELGIKWNINLFRHFAAQHYLQRHKGDLQGAADLCGNTPNTIHRNYAADRQEEAGDRLDEGLEADVEDARKVLATGQRFR
ncbi:MAG TPA: hypothetical protein VGR52_00335 [Stellaceae bacterium]|nr:hypothetical protein [Stellaceae bacterium]